MTGPGKSGPTLVPPPDGGWGWFVVFGSFMVHVFADGVTYSFGVFYGELVTYFNEGQGATAWIGSILVGVTLCSGPISSALVNRWNCRNVTIAGAIIASLGLALSSLAENILTLYVTVGLITGLGLGLIYLPAIVCVTCYFEKYRSLATGIAVCGSGLGTFLLAPLIEYLVNKFDWRGAFLITGGMMLNCILFGILFRPLEEPEEVVDEEKPEEPKELTPILNAAEQNGSAGQRPHSIHGAQGLLAPPQMGLNHKNNHNHSQSGQDKARLALSQPMLTVDHHRRSMGSGIMYRKDVLYSGSLAHIPLPSHKSAGHLHSSSAHHLNRVSSGEESTEKDTTTVCGCIPCAEETSDTLREMLDFSLLKDPIFIMFIVSNFCTSLGFNVPYIYMVTLADDRGVDRQDASYLLAMVGIANTIGRIVLGYLSDKPWVNRLWVYNICLAICGISTAMCILCYDMTTFCVYAFTFGFTVGAYVGLTSVILVDLLGLDKLTNAFGVLLLFQGLASLIGPPITGWLFDATGSYSPGFIFSGVVICISGLMLFSIPALQEYVEKKERRLQVETLSTSS